MKKMSADCGLLPNNSDTDISSISEFVASEARNKVIYLDQVSFLGVQLKIMSISKFFLMKFYEILLIKLHSKIDFIPVFRSGAPL